MSINIGQVMRGLLGDAQAGDSKALELKVGQVVRGVVMQVSDNQEAVVQINGTQVQAKLETPLQPGQATLLQVQPESANGTLVLKMVDQQAAAINEDSVKEWTKALALPDQKWATDLVRDIRRDGGVLTREVAQQFQQAAAAMPIGGDMQTWMQAAALAFKRGLPMTGATIGALQHSLSGAPAHVLLEALERGIAAWLGASGDDDAASGAAAKSSGAQGGAGSGSAANGSLGSGSAGNGGAGSGSAGSGSAASGGTGSGSAASGGAGNGSAVSGGAGSGSAVSGGAVNGSALNSSVANSSVASGSAASGSAGSGSTASGGVESGNTANSNAGSGAVSSGVIDSKGAQQLSSQLSGAAAAAVKLQALLAEGAELMRAPALEASPSMVKLGGALQGEAHAAMAAPAASAAEAPAPPAAQRAGAAGASAANAPQQAAQGAAANNTTAAAHVPPGGTSGWVGQLIKWLGVDHERLLALSTAGDPQQAGGSPTQSEDGLNTQPSDNKQAARTAEQAQAASHTGRAIPSSVSERALLMQQAGMSLPAVQADHVKAAADTFKSALMTLAAGDDVPQSLKDTAQQLVQHITGQQLLLTPERTASPFTHVTMFIPMQGPDGGQTASVHIQTRRGRKGELDADNCRLLFDLRMNTLGDTLVDVHVVDKIVSLNLWNDHPAISNLIESQRTEMTQALQKAGYQLLTLRSTPLSDRSTERTDGVEKKSGVNIPSTAEWSSKPYKGVDFRA
ncbi:hypothetical protein Back11_22380 [Paenibacillus baekrokdamisoli]|uniref:Uncharacterized protein n=1 Tax=Paenibacillus baekrokdamisoli TaxID=1712516 RepID=A0A3G9J7P3_9BACL|nr:hypothetical protein [Paenibacillus baekrokdamisoli]MBB3069753.1 hypothetical protein [Paenibacillus baekrokdamisoli]BBH20893.1 hypothetical protein Back11_22380 [Paenibacillus baekrokdamisoli]